MKLTPTGTKRRSARVEPPQLSQAEWDFRLLPEPELLACALYEYAREAVTLSPKLQQLLNNLAACHAAERGTEARARLFSVQPEILDALGGPLGCPHISPDMNETPWQALPERTRVSAMKAANYSVPAGAAHFSLPLSLAQISADAPQLHDYAPSVYAAALILGGSAEETEYGLFSIDWSFPREKIEDAFSAWLAARLAERPNRNPANSQRGKGKADSPRSWLKALAATRLMRAGLTAAAATDYTRGNTGAALFQDKAEWSKAKRQVAERLQSLFPQLSE